MSKPKTFADVITAIQDNSVSDAEAIAKLEALIRERKLQYDRAPQLNCSRDAEPRLRLVHSRPKAAPVAKRPTGLLTLSHAV